jgi:hypothetical protein
MTAAMVVAGVFYAMAGFVWLRGKITYRGYGTVHRGEAGFRLTIASLIAIGSTILVFGAIAVAKII